MIIGAVFVGFCLMCYLGPRTLEAFIDPPEPASPPPDLKKYKKLGDYMLDQTASVIYKQKRNDNVKLKSLKEMFSVREGYESADCGKFGCCEKIGIAKVDSKGSNCNGYCPYNDDSDKTPTSGGLTASATFQDSRDSAATMSTDGTGMSSGTTVFIPPPAGLGASAPTSTSTTMTCPQPPPCPACARCTEPSFECAKVPTGKSTEVPTGKSTDSDFSAPVQLINFPSFGL